MIKKILKDFIKNPNKVLFVLLILTLTIPQLTYSRYIEKAFGSSKTTLAKWEVIEEPISSDEIILVSKNVSEANYTFRITNTSEVASQYSITLSNIPENVTVKVDNNDANIYNPVNGTIYIENLGQFDAGDFNKVKNHTLTFISNTSLLAGTSIISMEVNVQQLVLSEMN